MKFILAKKLGMTQIYDEKGGLWAVTVVEASPNIVLQVRSTEKDGYAAVQVGFGARKAKNVKKPQKGHFKDLGNFMYVREFRVEDIASLPNVGDAIDVSVFTEGDVVEASAVSKGKGFAGVVKRHHFAGGPKTHGHKHNHRAPGSIGSRFPQHVHKGKRMAGHMGVIQVTAPNLKIMKVDKEHQLLAISGAIPGGRGALVKIISTN